MRFAVGPPDRWSGGSAAPSTCAVVDRRDRGSGDGRLVVRPLRAPRVLWTAVQELPLAEPAGPAGMAGPAGECRWIAHCENWALSRRARCRCPGRPLLAWARWPRLRPAAACELKLIDISLDGCFAAGVRPWAIRNSRTWKAAATTRERGFTVRQVELSMQVAADPYLDGEMHMVEFIDPIDGSTAVELAEAFMTTRSLPDGLQLKLGQFLTEFGRMNPTHHMPGRGSIVRLSACGFSARTSCGPGAVELACARRVVLAGLRQKQIGELVGEDSTQAEDYLKNLGQQTVTLRHTKGNLLS